MPKLDAGAALAVLARFIEREAANDLAATVGILATLYALFMMEELPLKTKIGPAAAATE